MVNYCFLLHFLVFYFRDNDGEIYWMTKDLVNIDVAQKFESSLKKTGKNNWFISFDIDCNHEFVFIRHHFIYSFFLVNFPSSSSLILLFDSFIVFLQ